MNNNENVVGWMILFYLILVSFISFWTERNLDYWFNYFSDRVTDFPYWICWLLTAILLHISVTANIVGELLRFIF